MSEHSQQVEGGNAANSTVTEELLELEFSPLAPEEAVALDDRVYLLGVHADRHRVL
jgi:hypothetical protein